MSETCIVCRRPIIMNKCIAAIALLLCLAGCGRETKYYKITQGDGVWYSTWSGSNFRGAFRTLRGMRVNLDGPFRSEQVQWAELPESIRERTLDKWKPSDD